MPLVAADIPKENIFAIGMHPSKIFHCANPRRPFVFNRAEALNLIGYIVALAELNPPDIDNAVREPPPDPFRTRCANDRFMVLGPRGPLFLFSVDEALGLISSLIRLGGLAPSEIDAAVVAIEEQAAGQSIEDVTKLVLS